MPRRSCPCGSIATRTFLGNFSYQRDRAAEARRHDRARHGRRRAPDPRGDQGVSAVSRLQRKDVHRGADSRPSLRPLREDLVGDVGRGALGADGHDRHGAAHRVRQRRQPAARADRRPPAGARDSRGARRRPGTPRPRADGREPRARAARRRRRRRAGVWPACGCWSRSRPQICRASGKSRSTCRCSCSRSCCRSWPARCSAASWCFKYAAPQLADGASRRRPLDEREPGAPARAERAGRRAGRAGDGAAGRLGPDDPDVPGVAARRARVHAARAAADAAHDDPVGRP